mgnify:CR=1 FL=1
MDKLSGLLNNKVMKIIRNNIIPPKGFTAINLFGLLFVRGNRELSPTTVTHERIHTRQMREMLYIFFYIWYVLEWLIRLLVIRNPHKAYRAISFEQEARVYSNIHFIRTKRNKICLHLETTSNWEQKFQ